MNDRDFPSIGSEQSMQLRIIGWALALGALVFAVVATVIPITRGGVAPAGGSDNASLVQLLSIVNGVLFASTLALASLAPSLLAQRSAVPSPQEFLHGNRCRRSELGASSRFDVVFRQSPNQ